MDGLPRVIDRHSANALGLTDSAIRHRVRTGRWRALHRGVYFTRGREPRDGDRLSAALLAAGPGSALSAAAALAQWRIRGIAVPARPLVLVPLSSGARSTPTVLVRRTVVPFDVRVVNDLRVVAIVRAVADYSVGLTRRDDVRAVVSEVMRRRLCTVEQLQSALSGVPRRGSAHLRLAVEEAALGAWSVPEAHLGRALRGAAGDRRCLVERAVRRAGGARRGASQLAGRLGADGAARGPAAGPRHRRAPGDRVGRAEPHRRGGRAGAQVAVQADGPARRA